MLIVGAVIIANVHVRQTCERLQIQPLVGFVLVGVVLALLDEWAGLLTATMRGQLDLIGQVGVIILLFRVGMNSDITGLSRQLRRALVIWLSNVTVAAATGFIATYYLIGYPLLPSLFVAVALSATSIGISTAVWEQAGALHTDDGELVVDVAELDDITAILLMVLLFAAAPLLADGDTRNLAPLLTTELLLMLLKLGLFTISVYLFARFAEQSFTRSSHGRGALTVAVTGMACLIAGLAAWIGFSAAIGALFAGLAFSRDPQEFQIDEQLEPIHRLLSPFFFVVVGLSFPVNGAGGALLTAALLLFAAVVGKVAGAGLPAMAMLDRRRGWLIGVSMVPRAEIAMIIMLQGARMGADYVPAELLSAMSLMVLATVLLVPLWLGRLLPAVANSHRPGDPPDNIRL